jgi:hypothetical protein
LIDSLNGAALPLVKLASPEYTATMAYVPVLWKLVEMFACLAATGTGDPICTPFDEKITVPVGIPPYCPVTVAVTLTC